jgi:lysophospholipase
LSGCVVSGEPSAAQFPPAFEGADGAETEKAVRETFARHPQGKALASFRSQRQVSGTFESARGAGVRLAWASFRHTAPKEDGTPRPELVFVTGVTDSFTRNLETLHDLHTAGFDVLTYDHRGQGASSRLSPVRDAVHVDAFADYVADLDTFLTKVQPRKQGVRRVFLAPSMGAAVGAMHNAVHKDAFDAAVYVVPMFEINFQFPGGSWVAGPLTRFLCQVGRCRSFVPGGKAWAPSEYEDKNIFTSDTRRHAFFQDLLNNAPALRHGSTTNGWAATAIDATDVFQAHYAEHRVPALVFTAERDALVLPLAHEAFCNEAKPCRRLLLPGAKHDALNETDAVRQLLLREATAFFADVLSTTPAAP